MSPCNLQSIDQYELTVKASDLNGGQGCNSKITTFNINIEDVNDNPPVLEKNSVRQHLFYPCVPTCSSVLKLDSAPLKYVIYKTQKRTAID